MENLKIRVTTGQESKEAQELLVSIGGVAHDAKQDRFGLIIFANNIIYSDWLTHEKHYDSSYELKEITIPQLKDMVVLKRNELKPIEEEMKEYLDKDYKLVEIKTYPHQEIPDGWIDVPQGAEILTVILGDEVFYKSGEPWEWYCEASKKWKECSDIVGLDGFQDILWHRKKESLNDKVASAEVARQKVQAKELLDNIESGVDGIINTIKSDNVNNPSHYNKGGVECIDAIQSSMTKEAFCGYLKGNIQKYVFRYENKGGVESLQKAQWYLNKLIEVEAS